MHPDHIDFHQQNLPQSDNDLIQHSSEHFEMMDTRRSIRDISDKAIPYEVIENIVRTASTAPSGAHKQPWTFCVVHNPELKQKIREAAEKEEYENYHGRMTDEWLKDLEVFGTDWHKEFITKAPYLIVVFKKSYDILEDGTTAKNYYVNESVGIACGFLLQAIHQAGLVSLTHTPSPMNFLAELLERPKNEKAFLLIPVGYAAEGATVPNIKRKSISEVLVKYY
ncbi:MAG: hypothetical protein RLZZ337_535 [Bacteroidota bacterium]|jgi:nitroreductase